MALQIMHKDTGSNLDMLLHKGNSMPLLNQNLQLLMIEIF